MGVVHFKGEVNDLTKKDTTHNESNMRDYALSVSKPKLGISMC